MSDEQPPREIPVSAENVHVDRRRKWDVLCRGDLVEVCVTSAESPGEHPVEDDGRAWTMTWLDIEDARDMALAIQDMCRLIEEGEALGTND